MARLPPGRQPGQTLSPMLLELDGRRVALAAPGADGPAETLVQIIRRLNDAGAVRSDPRREVWAARR